MNEKISALDIFKAIEKYQEENGFWLTYTVLKSCMETLVEDLLVRADEKAP